MLWVWITYKQKYCVFCLRKTSPLLPVATSNDPLSEERVESKKTRSLAVPASGGMCPSSAPCFPWVWHLFWFGVMQKKEHWGNLNWYNHYRERSTLITLRFPIAHPLSPKNLASVIFFFADTLTHMQKDISVRLFTEGFFVTTEIGNNLNIHYLFDKLWSILTVEY